MAVGRITRPDGKPIGIDGVKYDMIIVGNSGAGNEISYRPKPNPDGTWSIKLADGIYHEPRGKIQVPFDGDVYKYDLYPTFETGDTESAKGVVGDFHWRIRGPLKMYEAKPDPDNHTHWYGASARLVWNNTYSLPNGTQKSHNVPEKTTFVFTATPKGKLIDGSESKPLTWKLGWYALVTSFKPGLLNDIPPAVGGWTITGKEVSPDGVERPVAFRLSGSGKEEYQQSVDVKIEADNYGMPSVSPILNVTRAAP
jgi:hypothetical protein